MEKLVVINYTVTSLRDLQDVVEYLKSQEDDTVRFSNNKPFNIVVNTQPEVNMGEVARNVSRELANRFKRRGRELEAARTDFEVEVTPEEEVAESDDRFESIQEYYNRRSGRYG